MKTTPIIINSRDRLGCLRRLITWLEGAGYSNITILDNASTYPPLLLYYESINYPIIRVGNMGYKALWMGNWLQQIKKPDEYYVYTDPDVIPVDDCPHDFLAYFKKLLDEYEQPAKVGFGLKIDDLPQHYPKRDEVLQHEQNFWRRTVAPGVYNAPIDTTFALYRPNVDAHTLSAIRTGPPFVARHTSWYLDPANLPDDELYYAQCATHPTHWSSLLLK